MLVLCLSYVSHHRLVLFAQPFLEIHLVANIVELVALRLI